MNTTDRLERLLELLASDAGRFSNYQALPQAVAHLIAEHDGVAYSQNQLPLDEARYSWLTRTASFVPRSAVDIGSNLGYFAVSLALDYGTRAHAYEPVEAYAEASALIADIAGVGDLVSCQHREIGPADVGELPVVDLAVHLNVLHHLGKRPGTSTDVAEWRVAAAIHLRALSGRARHLLLQTGNMSDDVRLFESGETMPYVAELLSTSGWNVIRCGVLDHDSFTYRTFEANALADVPTTTCYRNRSTGLVDYYVDGQYARSLPTGLAQRPLWLCVTQEMGIGSSTMQDRS